MPLALGTRLGPYEIVAALGAGGMGEVYRARDPRLDRSVAIKVLPSHLTSDPERRARFEREAKAISSLNHPHICTVYDVGREDGTDYLVMEMVEGETLAQRLKKGALPLEQMLRTAIEIADALDKAHRQGLIHRDLKPGNVMLTKSGSKLMDFGLAKRAMGGETEKHLSALSTEAPPLTGEGRVLGTVAYMAPEQLEGKEADARSDLWAFGCVLYEMATGRRAFEGQSQASLISAIMDKDPPPITQLQPLTPPSFERLVKVCLAKDPDERLQTAHDVMQELRWIGEAPSGLAPTTAARPTRGARREALAWALALMSTAALARELWLGRRESGPPSHSLASFDILLPPDAPLAPSADFPLGIGKPALTVSPDGRRLVYVARVGGALRLRWRKMDGTDFRDVPGTDDAYGPFFSRDGERVGFFAQGRLKTVALDGSGLATLAEAPIGLGGVWAEDGALYFVPKPGGVFRIPPGGGAAEQVTRPIETADGIADSDHQWPECVPGREAILFATARGDIYVQSPGSAPRILVRGGSHPKLPAPSLLVFSRAGRLFAARFDARRLEVSGEPVPVLDGVRTEGPQSMFHGGAAQAAISANGALFYVPGRDAAESLPVWVDRLGREEAVGLDTDTYGTPSISPDGKRLAIVIVDAGAPDLWIYDLERRVETRMTKGKLASNPVWSHDGAQLFYAGLKGGRRSIIRADSNGDSQDDFVPAGIPGAPTSVSRDGRWLAYYSMADLWVLPLGKPAEVRAFLRTPAYEAFPQFSADGRWLAYTSDESGRWEVYVRPFAGPSRKYQVSSAGGEEPRWSLDGRELLYRYGESWFAAPVRSDPTFAAGAPRRIFEGPYINVSGFSYDVAPDGRLIVLKNTQQTQPADRLRVLLNWTDDVRRRVRSE
jgi:eukaryotic-like serine/threonine-protein kinase